MCVGDTGVGWGHQSVSNVNVLEMQTDRVNAEVSYVVVSFVLRYQENTVTNCEDLTICTFETLNGWHCLKQASKQKKPSTSYGKPSGAMSISILRDAVTMLLDERIHQLP